MCVTRHEVQGTMLPNQDVIEKLLHLNLVSENSNSGIGLDCHWIGCMVTGGI